MRRRLSRRHFLSLPALAAAPQSNERSVVAVVQGEERRKNIHDALVTIDDQIRLGLKTRKYVVIKPNNVSTRNQLASTHVDALRGILDWSTAGRPVWDNTSWTASRCAVRSWPPSAAPTGCTPISTGS